MTKAAAGTEDPNIVKGGPGQEVDAGDDGAGGDEGKRPAGSDAAKEPKLVTVNYGGKSFKVSPDVAATMKQQADDLEKARRDRWTKPPEEKKQLAKAVVTDDDPDDLMYTDPKAWKAKLKAEVRGEVMNEVRSAYTQDQTQKTFWEAFSKNNPDLEEARDIAEVILKKNYTEWVQEGLSLKDTIARLADKTRDRIDGLTGTKRGTPETRKAKKVSEGGESAVDRKAKGKAADDDAGDEDEEEVRPRSTAEILKARKKARQQLNTTTH